MQSTNVLVLCKLCKSKVPVGDLRRNKDGIFVCNTCYGKGYLATIDIKDLTPDRLRKKEEVKSVIVPKSDKATFYCTNCKFSFTRSVGSPNKGCPYCNKEHTVQRRESAGDLIKNVDDYFT